MDTVAYMALHAQDTLPDLSIGVLGDNRYLPNTLFQGGVAIVYIPHVDLSRSGGMLPQENFVMCVEEKTVRKIMTAEFVLIVTRKLDLSLVTLLIN